MMGVMPPEFVTATVVANRAGRSRSSLQRDIEAGLIEPAHQLPGSTGAYLFDEAEVERYLETMRASA